MLRSLRNARERDEGEILSRNHKKPDIVHVVARSASARLDSVHCKSQLREGVPRHRSSLLAGKT